MSEFAKHGSLDGGLGPIEPLPFGTTIPTPNMGRTSKDEGKFKVMDAKGDTAWKSKDEIMKESSSGAKKGQKLARHSLIPGDSLTQLAERYGLGAQKYAERNWEAGYEWSLSYDAMIRHATAFWNGEDFDQDPDFAGSTHLSAVAFHAFALMHYLNNQEKYGEFDDRGKK